MTEYKLNNNLFPDAQLQDFARLKYRSRSQVRAYRVCPDVIFLSRKFMPYLKLILSRGAYHLPTVRR